MYVGEYLHGLHVVHVHVHVDSISSTSVLMYGTCTHIHTVWRNSTAMVMAMATVMVPPTPIWLLRCR